MAFSKNWIAYVVSQGEPFTVDYLDRTFGKRKVRMLTIDDMSGETTIGAPGYSVALQGAVDLSGADSVVGIPASTFLVKSQDGNNGAGSLALTGAVVGDQVLAVTNLTSPADVTADFESVISVAGHIQQSSATDLSAKVCQFILIHQ